MSNLKPINFYNAVGGPNPYKVKILLLELDIPFTQTLIEDPKAEEYLKVNPNGRLPAISDPNNNDFVIWESGAILEYLVTKYDKENKLNVTDENEKWQLKQYLHFQMSGQGPYYGQAVWFHRNASDYKVGNDRYIEQTVRVFEVLERILGDKQYLLGDKCTYADLAFVPWNRVVLNGPFFSKRIWDEYDPKTKFPNFIAWHERLCARPAVTKAYE